MPHTTPGKNKIIAGLDHLFKKNKKNNLLLRNQV